MRSQTETITPLIAEQALLTAQCGRNPSATVIERYARDMANLKWRTSPQGVVYALSGTGPRVLRDGQQRYYAVIRAGHILHEKGLIDDPKDFSVRLYVTEGTEEEIEEAFPYLDSGKNRSGADYLTTQGRGNGTLLYTVGRRISLWSAGHMLGNAWKPTRAEVLAILEPQNDAPDETKELERVAYVEEAALFAKAWSVKPPVPAAGVMGFLWWLLGQINEQDRDTYCEFLRTGAGLTDEHVFAKDCHPLITLRTRLHADQYAAASRGTKVKTETVFWLCLRAWDAWRRKENTKKLQMPTKLTDAHFKQPR